MNEFNFVKGIDVRVQGDLANWENKIDDYVRELFNNELDRVYGTQFGDNLAIISDIAVLERQEHYRGR